MKNKVVYILDTLLFFSYKFIKYIVNVPLLCVVKKLLIFDTFTN